MITLSYDAEKALEYAGDALDEVFGIDKGTEIYEKLYDIAEEHTNDAVRNGGIEMDNIEDNFVESFYGLCESEIKQAYPKAEVTCEYNGRASTFEVDGIEEMVSIDQEREFEVGTLSDDSGEFKDNLSGDYCDTVWDAIEETSHFDGFYYNDGVDFIRDNMSYVEQALDENGWEAFGGSLLTAASTGYTLMRQDDIIQHLDDELLDFAFDYMEDKGCKAVPDSFTADFRKKEFNQDTKIADIKSFLDDYINEHDLSWGVDEKINDSASRVTFVTDEQTHDREDDAR